MKASGTIRSRVDRNLPHLAELAAFILEKAPGAYAERLARAYEALELPMLRFLTDHSREDRVRLLAPTADEMLQWLAKNNAAAFISIAVDRWRKDELPLTRGLLKADDITLHNHAKGVALRDFIPRYTSDPTLYRALVEEIDRFIVILHSELMGAFMDVQKEELEEMNAELRRREEQLLEAQAVGEVGSFEWDFKTRKLSATRYLSELLDGEMPLSLDDFLRLVHPEDRAKIQDQVQQALKTGQFTCEYRLRTKGGEKVIFSRGKIDFTDRKPRRLFGTAMDITSRSRIQQRLEESERLHKQAQAMTHIGNFSWNIRTGAIHWSDELYRICGLVPQSEKITFERFASFLHPDDRARHLDAIRLSLERLTVEEHHVRIIGEDGTEKVLHGRGEISADAAGQAECMRGTYQDVTREFTLTRELRERERYLAQLNRSLQVANRDLRRTNEELETFNFISSHDLQEPLRKIQVYTTRILDGHSDELSDELQLYFTKITQASARMQKLINDLLTFSQTLKTDQVPVAVDTNETLAQVLRDLGGRIEETGATVETDALPVLWGVPYQIHQLLLNLLANALKYIHPQRQPRIVLRSEVVAGKDLDQNQAQADRNYHMIAVTDNGIGFESKYKDRIFELFQRLHTRETYSGTGIGLALCRKIVQNMQGFIEVESAPSQGSVFRIYLPVAEGAD